MESTTKYSFLFNMWDIRNMIKEQQIPKSYRNSWSILGNIRECDKGSIGTMMEESRHWSDAECFMHGTLH